MKRLLLFLACAGVCLAQIPSDTVVATLKQRLTAYRAFIAAHPNAREFLRLEDAIHFDNGDGTGTALLQSAIAHVDPDSGEIDPTDLDLVQTQAGYRTVGSPIVVRVVDGPLVNGNPTSMVQTFRKDPQDKTVTGYAIVTTPLTYQSDFRFTFQQQGLAWTLDLTEYGWDLRASVATSQGPKTYRFGYTEVNMTLDPDADGNLSVPSGRYKITRPVMLRADGVETPCSSWLVDRAGVRIGFTCDDTGFPAEAYPYVIDPTGSFYSAAGTDDSRSVFQYHVATSPGYQPCAAFWPPDISAGTTVATDTAIRVGSRSYPSSGTNLCMESMGFIRFNTSTIPGGNAVVSATMNLFLTTSSGAVSSGYTLNAGYYSASNWPTGDKDFLAWPTANAFSGVVVTSLAPYNAYKALPLSNIINIVPGAWTGFRLWVPEAAGSNGGTTQDDGIYFNTYDAGSNRPYLSVTYQLNTGPQTVSATPHSGTLAANAWYTFTIQMSDADGFGNINYYHMQLSAGPVGAAGWWDAHSCFLHLIPSTRTIGLRDDANSTWGTEYAAGTAAFPENSQCKIDVENSLFVDAGTTSTATLRLLLKPAFSGGGWTKHTYSWVVDGAGASAGWTDFGSWTLTPGGPKLIMVNQ